MIKVLGIELLWVEELIIRLLFEVAKIITFEEKISFIMFKQSSLLIKCDQFLLVFDWLVWTWDALCLNWNRPKLTIKT